MSWAPNEESQLQLKYEKTSKTHPTPHTRLGKSPLFLFFVLTPSPKYSFVAGTSAQLFWEEVKDAKKSKRCDFLSYLISSGGMHPSSSLLNTLKRRRLNSDSTDVATLYFHRYIIVDLTRHLWGFRKLAPPRTCAFLFGRLISKRVNVLGS